MSLTTSNYQSCSNSVSLLHLFTCNRKAISYSSNSTYLFKCPSSFWPLQLSQIIILALLSEASATMKKLVLKVDLYDDRIKQKAMKAASGISVYGDMKDNKLILTGDVDPVNVVAQLRKWCHTEIVSVGPAKGENDPTKVPDPLKLYEAHPLYYQIRPPQYNQYYYVGSVEEDPTGCVIC